jgi:hypothetical protein
MRKFAQSGHPDRETKESLALATSEAAIPSFESFFDTGLPDFSWYKIPKREKIF